MKAINKIVLKGVKSLVSAGLILCMLFMSACVFTGTTTRVESINFNEESITIAIGQTVEINLTRVTIAPRIATNKRFTVSVSNNEVVSISDNKITGVTAGEVTVTVVTEDGEKTDSCKLYVQEQEPEQLKIEWYGSLFQDTTNLTTVTFYPNFGMIESPSKIVTWQVNSLGSVVEGATSQSASKPFSFLPSGAGEFEIVASMTSGGFNFSDSVVLRAYDPYLIEPEVVHESGELVQSKDNYESVKFKVTYTDAVGNPKRVIRWLLNDTYYSSGEEFSFLPSRAGIFNISVEIDGKLRQVASITAKGGVVPTNLRLDYDNDFPNVYLHWDDMGIDNNGFLVEVRDSNGLLVNLKGDSGDISTARDVTSGLFSGNSVNLTSVIGLDCNKNLFNNKFTFAVKSLGNGSLFEPSELSTSISSRQLDIEAKKYLESRILGGAKNLYASDFFEFVEIMKEAFFWRDNPILTSSMRTDYKKVICYVEFSVVDEVELISSAYRCLHITGDVEFSINYNDKILEYSVTFNTDSLPSKRTDTPKPEYSGGLGAVRPHINYDKSKVRNSLPIDKNSKTVEVTNSEQLYFVAQSGLRPVPKKGSDAEVLYDYARNILYQIITDDMTQVQKAHAIYDWIMWQVDYDHAVLGYMSLKEAVKYEAYYLEGVLNNSYTYAVCDAISKAYALLANMEGLECVRVTGVAGLYSKSGHAWNKVKVDGRWYIVDATWGDEIREFKGRLDTEQNYEMALHRYFLLTDSQIAQTHIEDEVNNFPRTTNIIYDYYDDDFVYEGESLDYYFNCSVEELDKEVMALTKFMLDMRQDGLNGDNLMYIYAVTVPGSVKPFSNYIGFDIKVNSKLSTKFNGSNCALSKAFLTADENKAFIKGTDYFVLSNSADDALYLTVIIPLE